MELKLGLLCDAANVAEGGKLNILGEFNVIYSAHAPVSWPMFTLVARVEGSLVEGLEHEVHVDLWDADGGSLMSDRPGGPIEFRQMGPGRPIRAQVIAQVQGLSFPRFGDYEFLIIVDGQSIGAIPVYIVHREPPPPPAA